MNLPYYYQDKLHRNQFIYKIRATHSATTINNQLVLIDPYA
jgi:hypothetical protein